MSTKSQDFCEIRESEVNCSIIEDAERIFSDTFLAETNQNQRSNFHIASVTIPAVNVPPKKVGCFTLVHTIFCHKKTIVLCFLLYLQCFQEDKRVNWVLPGSLMPLEKGINSIFRTEKARLMSNPRFSKIFSNVEIKHVFSNRATLKKLIVRTKVG